MMPNFKEMWREIFCSALQKILFILLKIEIMKIIIKYCKPKQSDRRISISKNSKF